MKKYLAKVICVLLSVVMLIGIIPVSSFATEPCDCDYTPVLIIPGFVQSKTRLYDDMGDVVTKEDGNEYMHPFFLDDTMDIVKIALKKVGLPLMSLLFKQEDSMNFAEKFARTACEVLVSKIMPDGNGFSSHVKPDRYLKPYSECTAAEQAHILSCIPLQKGIDILGGDHVYFFSYDSFGNLDTVTRELYEMIELVKEQTGHDKINIVPISQGGTLFNNLIEYYPQVAESFERVILAIPALDGTKLISEIYTKGLLDDPESLYGEMWPTLMGDMGHLVNVALRIFPNSVLNDLLDRVGDELLGNYMKNSTCLWAFLTGEDYEEAADKYLSDEEDANIRRQTDSYQVARLNSDRNILRLREQGVEVFDIVNYNVHLYPLVDSWDDINADGIIHLDSTSMGAYSLGNDKTLPEGYVQRGNSYGTCSDPTHNHIDPHNILDASTGLLPDHTFYFYNGSHDRTAGSDALISLVVRLLTDRNFKNVYSYPDMFPQFNTERYSRFVPKQIRESKEYLEHFEDEALLEAVNAAEAMLENTVVDAQHDEKIIEDLDKEYSRVFGINKTENFFNRLFNKFVVRLDEKALEKYGYNSFSGK